MVHIQELSFPSSDGIHTLRGTLWLPEGDVRCVVQIVHGIAEYIARYDEFARFLAENGCVVGGIDLLGHGGTAEDDDSYGFFAPFDGWTLVTADVREVHHRLRAAYPGVPGFLLGHSMGSFLVRTFLCRYPGETDGAILSGTGQESALLICAGKTLAQTIGRIRGKKHVSPLLSYIVLCAYNKAFRPNRTAADWISRDNAVVDAYIVDPLCQHPGTVGLFADMLGGLQYIAKRRNLARMDPATPVYLYSGAEDPVGSRGTGVKKVYSYFARHGTEDLRLKLYPDARHEMHNELNRRDVYTDVLTWLMTHI